MKRSKGNAANRTALVTLLALSLLLAGCSPSEQDATTESQPGASQTAGVAVSTTAQDFEPEYIGGYPTEETAERDSV